MRQRRHSPWLGQGMIYLLSGCLLWGIGKFSGTVSPKETAAAPSGNSRCHTPEVLDGDTLKAVCDGVRVTLRLQGIDAPEMGQAPYGDMAREALIRRVPPQFGADIRGTDIYGRSLAVIGDTAGDINLWLVRQGFAPLYRSAPSPAHYHAAEEAAKREKLGVWHKPGDQQNPQVWRRYHL